MKVTRFSEYKNYSPPKHDVTVHSCICSIEIWDTLPLFGLDAHIICQDHVPKWLRHPSWPYPVRGYLLCGHQVFASAARSCHSASHQSMR